MIMQNSTNTVADMKEHIEKELAHSYMKKFIRHPQIDEDKLFYICSFLKTLPISDEEFKTYVTSIMLVQTALDAHDLVTIQALQENDLLKQRQLTVLSGDYYSGLYYSYLSQQGSISLIRETSAGIKDINVAKMKLYYTDHLSTEEALEHLYTIETSLIQSLCRYFGKPEWQALLGHAMYMKLLFRLLDGQKPRTSFLTDRIKGEQEVSLETILYPSLVRSQAFIQESASKMSGLDEELQNDLNGLFQRFKQSQSRL